METSIRIIDGKCRQYDTKVILMNTIKGEKKFYRLDDVAKILGKELVNIKKTKCFQKQIQDQTINFGYEVECIYIGDIDERGYYYSEDGIDDLIQLLDKNHLSNIVKEQSQQLNKEQALNKLYEDIFRGNLTKQELAQKCREFPQEQIQIIIDKITGLQEIVEYLTHHSEGVIWNQIEDLEKQNIKPKTQVPYNLYILSVNPNIHQLRNSFYQLYQKYIIEGQQTAMTQHELYVLYNEFDLQIRDKVQNSVVISQNEPSIQDKNPENFYVGMMKYNTSEQRPYQHKKEFYKYCALYSQLNNIPYIHFCNFLEQYPQYINQLINVKIFQIEQDEDYVRQQEIKYIYEFMNQCSSNDQNYRNYKNNWNYTVVQEFKEQFNL